MGNSGEQYCAFCRNTIYNGNFKIIEGVTNDILEVILLKLDFGDGGKKVMCEVCSQNVIEAFKFKSMCLYTDNTLISYVDDETECCINLREIYAKEKGLEPLTDLLDEDNVCRLCIQLIKTEFISVHDMNVDMIDIYIPEINFSVVKDAVICKRCFDSFDTHSSFIRKYKKEIKEDIKPSLISCIETEEIYIKSETNEKEEELSQSESSVVKSGNEKVSITTKSVEIQTDADNERLRFSFDNDDDSNSETEDLFNAEQNSAIPEGNDLCEELIENEETEKILLCTYCGIFVTNIKEHVCGEKLSTIQEGSDLCEELPENDGSEKTILCTNCGIFVTDIKEHVCGELLNAEKNSATHKGNDLCEELIEKEGIEKTILCTNCGIFAADTKKHICGELLNAENNSAIQEKNDLCEELEKTILCTYCGIFVANRKEHICGDLHEKDKKAKYPTKRHYCIYCKTLHTKLSRHLECKHGNEIDVKEAFVLSKGSRDRRLRLLQIQKKGDFLYNTQHKEPKEFISVRRSIKGKRNAVKVPCPYCQGFYSKVNIRNHVRVNCREKHKNQVKKPESKRSKRSK